MTEKETTRVQFTLTERYMRTAERQASAMERMSDAQEAYVMTMIDLTKAIEKLAEKLLDT